VITIVPETTSVYQNTSSLKLTLLLFCHLPTYMTTSGDIVTNKV